jgi:hypothetical protein
MARSGYLSCATCVVSDGTNLEWVNGLLECRNCDKSATCEHPAPEDFGSSQVYDGVLVHPCSACGLLMAWQIAEL